MVAKYRIGRECIERCPRRQPGPKTRLPGDNRLGALVERHAVTHLLMVPSLYRMLLDRRSDRLTSLTTAIVAGEETHPNPNTTALTCGPDVMMQLAAYRLIGLGVEPAAETTALYERIQTLRVSETLRVSQRVSEASLPRHNLPPQPTPFVGREQELADLNHLLNTCK